MADEKPIVVILTHGKSDNGRAASLAFSCALSGLTLGVPAVIFLTGDGAVWGYKGSAQGISVQGFPNLETLIEQYVELGGRTLLCAVCHKTCGAGGPSDPPTVEPLPSIEIAGFATAARNSVGRSLRYVLERVARTCCVTSAASFCVEKTHPDAISDAF